MRTLTGLWLGQEQEQERGREQGAWRRPQNERATAALELAPELAKCSGARHFGAFRVGARAIFMQVAICSPKFFSRPIQKFSRRLEQCRDKAQRHYAVASAPAPAAPVLPNPPEPRAVDDSSLSSSTIITPKGAPSHRASWK